MANVFTNLSRAQIVSASKGNPGAAMAMMDMINMGCSQAVEKILSYGISGSDIYVLYSDLCNKNAFLCAKLVEVCPREILIDAASRQDFSGRELVVTYLNELRKS